MENKPKISTLYGQGDIGSNIYIWILFILLAQYIVFLGKYNTKKRPKEKAILGACFLRTEIYSI